MEETLKDGGREKGSNAPRRDSGPSSNSGEKFGAQLMTSKLIAARSRRKDDSIRMVTPEPADATSGGTAGRPSDVDVSSQASPRSIIGGQKPRERRQGLVFEDTFEAGDSSTLQRHISNGSSTGDSVSKLPHTRPRNRTIDGPQQQRHPSAPVSFRRHRIGSNLSTGGLGSAEEIERITKDDSGIYIPQAPPAFRSAQAQRADSVKKKPPVSGRLVKQSNPRSRSVSPAPFLASVDTLPVPIPTDDASRTLKLMASLAGRMRGEVEYQTTGHGSWASGICYIDERGSLLYEGVDRGPFHQTIVPDLRGCRIKPPIDEKDADILDVNIASGMRLRLRPLDSAQCSYWLAALLCWQQNQTASSQSSISAEPGESRSLSRRPSFNQDKNINIIKVGRVLLWDKGVPPAPAPVTSGKKVSHKEPRRHVRSWQKVSCILQDNGEFKLMTENDIVLLATIQLSQLSRSAIQQLDKTVLNQEYCIAIFPQYTQASTSLSIIKPVYISLESRVLFEVWFVLLRAFTVPEIYGSQFSTERSDEPSTPDSLVFSAPDDLFRIEKTLSIRIVEAKIRSAVKKPETSAEKNHKGKAEPDPSVADYFAEVVLDGEVRARTTTKVGTMKPFWREDCEFSDLPAALPEVSIVLKKMGAKAYSSAYGSRSAVNLHSHETASESLCGIVQIRMDQLERGKDVETWWPILNERKETVGEMLVKVRHDELAVLLLKDYQPLSDLLHKFNTGLTLQMSQFVPSKLRFLAETLLDVFQVSGQSAQWLVALVEDEIDGIGKESPVQRLRFSRRLGSNDSLDFASDREVTVRDMNRSLTGEANLLFRGNSLLTQALDCHMRRVGMEYLEDVVGEKVREINTTIPDCEVDPSRLTPDENLGKNWLTLNALTTDMWSHISSSYHRCPAELRQVLKYIRAVAEDRYGDFLRTVPYTSVSGFLFLRFFCPALLNPKLFGLLRDHPHPKAQRTLTLIAKSLQVLSNLSTFGQKEAWMEPMNRFLAQNRQSVKDFIDNICSIPTERSHAAPPASYSTPLAILKRLPPVSREGFPSLPYLIDDARTFAALVKFWLEATAATDGLTGDLLSFHTHCVGLQRRTEECLRRAEQDAKSETAPELAWEDILRSLEVSGVMDQRSFTESDLIPGSFGGASSYPHAAPPRRWNGGEQRSVPGSAGSETGSRERRERQSFWEATFGKEASKAMAIARPLAFEAFSVDGSKSSPPVERGSSRDGKGDTGKVAKGFLIGLRKKAERERDKEKEKEEKGEKPEKPEKQREKLDKEGKKEKNKEARERYFQDAWEKEKDARMRDGEG